MKYITEDSMKFRAVREACIKANPEGVCNDGPEGHRCSALHCDYCEKCPDNKIFRLADVLLAIEQSEKVMNFGYGDYPIKIIGINSNGYFVALGGLDGVTPNSDPRWNLRSDDLSLQSPQTIDFLYELLKADPHQVNHKR